MPKAALHFTLPDEQSELDDALNGSSWHDVASSVFEKLQIQIKHRDELSDDTREGLKFACTVLLEAVAEYGLEL